jgi:hypothetical protein
MPAVDALLLISDSTDALCAVPSLSACPLLPLVLTLIICACGLLLMEHFADGTHL